MIISVLNAMVISARKYFVFSDLCCLKLRLLFNHINVICVLTEKVNNATSSQRYLPTAWQNIG